MDISSIDTSDVLRRLLRRCVVCPEQSPVCGACPSGQVCIQQNGGCDSCPKTVCVPLDTVPGSSAAPAAKSGPNVGAIAGGVVGGVVIIIIAIFLIWKFKIKGRRTEEQVQEEWQEVEIPQEKVEPDFNSRRDARASTHTVASLASTVLTRASNIIQIAYIPGVTNRSGAGSPGVLVPPVPPIPLPTSPSSLGSPYSTEDQHFFLPGNLRDSTYSALTDGRSSFARTSITPSLARSSVATTIYRNNAIVSPLPAQTIVRGKAAVVSVKSAQSQANSPIHTPGNETPPVPQIDFERHKGPVKIQMPRSTDNSLHPSPNGSLRGMYAKPVTVNVGKSKSNSSLKNSIEPKERPLTEVSVAESDVTEHARARRSQARSIGPDSIVSDSDSDLSDDDHARARRSLLGPSKGPQAPSIQIHEAPNMLQSPFLDEPSSPDVPSRNPKRNNLETVTEEASKRANNNKSPFSDAHAVNNS